MRVASAYPLAQLLWDGSFGQPGTIISDITTRLTYDPWSGGLKRIKAGEVATALAADLTYTRTAAGLVRSLADARVAAPAVATFTYSYDDVGRLIGESLPMALPGDLSKSLALTYDNVVGRPSGLQSVSDPLRGAFAYGHDADGNVTSGVNLAGTTPTWRSFRYGSDGMPSAIGTMGAFYDEGGERAIKRTCGAATCPAASTTYYFGPHYEIRNGVATRYIFAGGQRMAKVDATGVWYLHKDQVGSTVAVTSGGQVRWRGSYQLLGALRTECATMGLEACAPTTTVTRPVPYLFGDHEYDAETGLYYYGARYYDPIVGRFTSPDTMVPRPFDPQSFNRYAFQRNDPLNRVDPDGHDDTFVLPPLQADCSIMDCGGGSAPPGWDQADSFDGTFGSGPGMGGGFSGGGARPVLAAPSSLSAGGIAAPSGVWSYVPGVGSAWSVAYNLQQGDYAWAAVSAGFLMLDLSMVGGIASATGKWAAKTIGRGALELGGGGASRIAAQQAAEGAARLLPAARQIEAAWGANTYRHGGPMTGIEHIMYRHSASSGFANVSRFAQGTRARTIAGYVDDALRYGTVTQRSAGAYIVEHNLRRAIGTNVAGDTATSIRVFIRDGIIQTAFPF